MNLRPRIIRSNGFCHITFGLNPQEYEDEDELAEITENFIDKVLDIYLKHYCSEPGVTKVGLLTDSKVLASYLLYELGKIEKPEKGSSEIVVHFQDEVTKDGLLGNQTVNYTVHWHSLEEGDLLFPVFPVGFQMFHINQTKSRFVFDTRVLHRDLIQSRDFYLEKAIPELDSYFEYLKKRFKQVSNNEFNIDLNDVRATLCQQLEEHYEHRLNHPDEQRQLIFFMDAYLVGGVNPDDVLVKFDISYAIKTVLTPEIRIGTEGYQLENPGKNTNEVVIKSFSSTRTQPVKDEIPELKLSVHKVLENHVNDNVSSDSDRQSD